MSETGGPQKTQIVLLGLLLLGGVGYFGNTYVYQPRAAEIAEKLERLEELELQNRSARMLAEGNGQDEVERRLAGYREQLAQVEGLVPSSEELPDLLDAIAVEAQRAGVELSLIQPVAAAAEDYYTRRTYALGVLGSYHQIGDFLTRVATLPRIITPVDLRLRIVQEETRSGNPQLEAKFVIETYVLPLNQVINDVSAPR